jgi:hypothetical protein
MKLVINSVDAGMHKGRVESLVYKREQVVAESAIGETWNKPVYQRVRGAMRACGMACS